MNRQTQRGIVMVIALILLAVMTIGAVAAYRRAYSGAVSSNGLRSQNLALQAAEGALRYCESQLQADAPTVHPQAAPLVDGAVPVLWKSISAWQGTGAVASAVPLAQGQDATPEYPAQCLIEEMILPRVKGADESLGAYIVTARGFSPDYVRRAAGLSAGAEAWVQSVVRASVANPSGNI